MALPTSSTYAAPVDLATAYLEVEGDAIAPDDDVSATIAALAAASSDGSLYIQMPDSADSGWSSGGTLYCGYTDLSAYSITAFGLIESDVAVTLAHSAAPTDLSGYSWTNTSGNIWRCTVSATVYQFLATTNGSRTEGVCWGKPWASAALTENETWYADGTYLYIWSTVGDPSNYQVIECYLVDHTTIFYLTGTPTGDLVLGTKTERQPDEYLLTLKGAYRTYLTGLNVSGGAHTGNGEFWLGKSALVRFLMASVDSPYDAYLRCNAEDSILYGVWLDISAAINITDPPRGFSTVYVGGIWSSANPAPMKGAQVVVYENPLLKDPNGRALGYSGATSGNNNAGLPICPTDGPPYYERNRGWKNLYVRQVTGNLRCQYGLVDGWTGATGLYGAREALTGTWTNTTGNIWTHPLSQAITAVVTTVLDSAGDGTGTGGRQRNWGDPQASAGAVDSILDWYATDSLLTIYSPDGDPGSIFDHVYGVVSYFDAEYIDPNWAENGTQITYAQVTGAPGWIVWGKHSNTFSHLSTAGDWTTPAGLMFLKLTGTASEHAQSTIVPFWGMQDVVYSDNVVNGTWNQIRVDGSQDPAYNSWSGNCQKLTLYNGDTATKLTCTDLVLSGTDTLVEYSYIGGTVSASGTPHEINRARFTGAARQVLTIAAGATVEVNSPSFVEAGTFTANGTGTLYVNGDLKSLPYTFTAVDSLDNWWIPPEPQQARPDGDVSVGGWIAVPSGSLYSAIDEGHAAGSETDYIYTNMPTSTFVVSLSPLADPGAGTGLGIRWHGRGKYVLILEDASTSPATGIWTYTVEDLASTTHIEYPSAGAVASIADWGQLQIKGISGGGT